VLTRRELLAAGVGVGVGALGAGGVLDALAKVGPRRRGLGAVEHIVVFMQENRSFDTYFGTLRGVRGFGDKHALELPSGRSVFHQPDALNPDGFELPFHLDTKRTSAQCVATLSHAWAVQHAAWNHGRMDRWIPAHRAADGASGPMTMGYYSRNDLPYYYALADAFTICDRYHCSVMGSTNPNRLYLWTGTVDPGGQRGGPGIDNSETPPYRWTTYPERLQKAGVSWRIYQEPDNFDDNALAWFKRFQQVPKSSPLAVNGLIRRSAEAFADDVARDRLPQISWIIAPSTSSEHPPFTPAAGAELTGGYLRALAEHPKVWQKTAFVLVYDENDGFFDHVRPPAMHYAAPTGNIWVDASKPFETLGVRIPGLVVSPLVEQGSVFKGLLDHTSILQLIVDRFGTASDLAFFGDAQARKDKQVASLSSVLTRTTPRGDILTGLQPPPFPTAGATTPAISDLGRMFRGVVADRPAKSR